jgi:hypothetical protein
MFSILNCFDLAACQDFCRKRKKMSDLFQEYKNIPYEFSEYNSGVIVFRNNSKTQQFFADWRRWFYETKNAVGGWDQPSFRVALWNSDLRIHTLPPEFNVRSLSQQRRVHRRRKNPTTPEVLHPRILHWRGVGRRKILFFTRHYRASKY